MRQIDISKEIENIVIFIRDILAKSGHKKLIVGLSGGIDSALTAALCAKAVGTDNVIAFMMPYKNSHPDSLYHATLVAEELDIAYRIIPITGMVDSYFDEFENDADRLRRGNFMARIRMCILYDLSNRYSALVAGTGNKSELYVGYCTQYGDSACAFEPIGHLYKTEVREMAKSLKIPREVIQKKPTADLWDNQTDEDELGMQYSRMDLILYDMLDNGMTDDQLVSQGYAKEEITKLKKLIAKSEFKRNLPPIPELAK